MRYVWVWLILCGFGAPALAAPESGDIFREYVWAGPWVNAPRWQRLTGPDATPDRAKAHLPNPVNQIETDDLHKARKAEVYIEMLLCHGDAGDVIGINGRKVVTKVGKNHDLSYDSFAVPVEFIVPETNTLYTYSDTHHHGLEVQWPGMVLFLQYDEPEQIPASR